MVLGDVPVSLQPETKATGSSIEHTEICPVREAIFQKVLPR